MTSDTVKNVKNNYCKDCKPRNNIISAHALNDERLGQIERGVKGLFKNTFIINGRVIYAYTSNGECFLFDTDDLEKVKKHVWRRKELRGGWYVAAMIGGKETYLHTLIMNNLAVKKRVDHINRDKLDNRKINLRFCTPQKNAFNQGLPKTNTLGYKGIQTHANGRWNARIAFCQRNISLGLYDTIQEAAAAYDLAAEMLFGEFAWLNRDHLIGVRQSSEKIKAYVVHRCIQRVSGFTWDKDPDILQEALNRLESKRKQHDFLVANRFMNTYTNPHVAGVSVAVPL
jgi:hypothetical protein